LLEEPFLHRNGRLPLPTRPGLGVEINPWKLRRYGTHFFAATKLRMSVQAVFDKGLATARELGAKRDERLTTRSAQLDAIAARGEDPALTFLSPSRPAGGEGRGEG
jgi:hypothetical protein